MTTATLTVPFALRLGDLLTWTAQGRRVRFLSDRTGAILEGTLRHVVRGEDDFCFLGSGQDVRDAFVRITLSSGLDVALSVTRAVALIEDGAFAVD